MLFRSNAWPQSASTGSAVCAKKATPASFSMNTISAVCPSAGGLQNMAIVLLETSACMLILKNVVQSAPTTSVGSVNSVS